MHTLTLKKIPLLESLRHTPHVCFAEAVRAANRAVTKRYAEYMPNSEVNVAQASLLMRLYYLGEATMAKLAEQMETERTTMVRNVAILERSGHVETIIPKGSRAHLIRLTDKGFAALEIVLPYWERAQHDLKHELGEQLWSVLLGGMRRLVEIEDMACPRTSR